jgi:hypothetical protein
MVARPVTREDAVRLLSEAGVPLEWPAEYALPISRVELTRRLMGVVPRCDVDDFEPEDDDFAELVLMAVEDDLGFTMSASDWEETDPQTYADMVLLVEERLRRRWHGKLARVPGGCASQSVFYAVRRMLGEGMAFRARPTDPLPSVHRAAEPLNRAILRQYGVSLPQERRVFGRLPIAPTWFVLWLAASAWFLALIPATDTLWLSLFAMLPVLGLVHVLSRPVWPAEFRTFGDVVRCVVAEHARNHERMRLALRRADA